MEKTVKQWIKSKTEWAPKDFRTLATMLSISLVFLSGAALMNLFGVSSIGSDGISTKAEVATFLRPGQVLAPAALPAGVTAQPVPVIAKGRLSGLTEHLLARAQILPMLAVVIAVVVLLRRMLLDVAEGQIFTRKNAGRVRIIGVILMASTLLSGLSQIAASELASRQLGQALVSPYFELSFAAPGAGALLLALAAVFDAGVKLREDNEATI